MDFKPIIRRLVICVAIAVIAVFALSEVAFLFQRDRVDRGPQTIELVIPSGTAQLIAEGIAPPEIPAEMVFVLGDELRVVNNDRVDHQLGPVWVPPGGTASLQLGDVEHVAVSCSFQPTQYMGIRVEEPTTIYTRLLALAVGVPPTAAILLVYSLAAYPLKTEEEDVETGSKKRANRDRSALQHDPAQGRPSMEDPG